MWPCMHDHRIWPRRSLHPHLESRAGGLMTHQVEWLADIERERKEEEEEENYSSYSRLPESEKRKRIGNYIVRDQIRGPLSSYVCIIFFGGQMIQAEISVFHDLDWPAARIWDPLLSRFSSEWIDESKEQLSEPNYGSQGYFPLASPQSPPFPLLSDYIKPLRNYIKKYIILHL